MEFMIFNWYSDDRVNESESESESERDSDSDNASENKNESTDNDMPTFHIYLFGITESGKSVCVDVTGWTPYFYLEIPKEWKNNHIENFVDIVKGYSKNWLLDDHLIGTKVMKKKDAYGYHKDPKRFIRFVFNNYRAYRQCSWNFKEQYKNHFGSKNNLYNSKLDPMLSFMHTANIKASGWVTFKDPLKVEASNISNVDICLTTHWKNITAIDKDIIPPLKILSFDIESYSKTGEFPNPEKKCDQIIQIGTSIQRYGTTDVKKHCVVLGECNPIDDVEVVACKTEKELLDEWFKLVSDENPDVITGYNIHGFDWWYINTRCEMLKVNSNLSRLYHVPSKMYQKTMESSAYGFNEYKYIETPGINQIDMYSYFRKDTTLKLSSYKLDYVADHFLGERKRDVSVQEIFKLGGPDGTAESRARVADYCVQDTMLPIRLMNKRMVLPNLIEMSKCSYVPLVWLILRGQQIKAYSQLQYEFKKEGYVFPDKIPLVDNEKYKGATVLTCTRGAYVDINEPVAVNDFQSLYPSIIIAHNLCPTTLVLNDNEITEDDDVKVHEWNDSEIEASPKKYKFKVILNKPGIVARVMKRLWDDRIQVKKLMKAEKDPNMKAVLNAKQLAIKVTMNSIYGVFGASQGYLCMKPIAMIVTYLGRSMIEHSKNCAEKYYDGTNGVKAEVVYGDSVPGYMPITIRRNGKLDTIQIKDLYDPDKKWDEYKTTKQIQYYPRQGIQVWTSDGFNTPLRIIKHKTQKKIYRIVTQQGIIECTEDHSLFTQNRVLIKPQELKVGMRILCNPLPN